MKKVNKVIKNIFVVSDSHLPKRNNLNYKNRYVPIKNDNKIIFKRIHKFLISLNQYNFYELLFFDFNYSNEKIYFKIFTTRLNSISDYYSVKKHK